MVKKEAGGPWDCYHAYHFYGWEAERVVAVTSGHNIMELITRAKTHLIVILVEAEGISDWYEKTKKHFHEAADLGLVEMVQLSADAVEINQGEDET